MNYKLIALTTAMTMSAALAQYDEDEYEEEESSAPATEEVSAAEPMESAAPATEAAAETVKDAPAAAPSGVFDVLHGNAYNLVGSAAGASTIADDMNKVYSMYGRNLLYVEPSGENATLALTKGGLTYLLAFDNQLGFEDQDNLGLITAGMALGNMGVAVDFAIAKAWTTSEVGDAETNTSTTEIGDLINVKFGMLLGALDLTANVYWLTFETEEDTETDAGEEDNDFWDIGANVAISNSPSGTSTFWAAGLRFLRQSNETITEAAGTKTEVTHNDAFTQLAPFFDIAFTLFGNETAQVYLGTNTRLPITFFDETDSERTQFSLYTSPNILAEVALNENILVFGGATYNWLLFGYEGEEYKASNTDNSTISMKTYNTSANAGIRFAYKNLVLEASIADDLGSSAWSGLIGNFGAMLTF